MSGPKETGSPHLGRLLVKAGRITIDELRDALETSSAEGKRLGKVLIERGLITQEDLIRFIEIKLGHPVIRMGMDFADPEVVRLVPERFARSRGVLPLFRIGPSRYAVGMTDPWDIRASDEAALALNGEIEVIAISGEELDHVLDQVWERGGERAGEVDEEDGGKPEPLLIKQAAAEGEADEIAPVARIIETLISEALEKEASSIHLEPKAKCLAVRFKIDGFFHTMTSLPVSVQGPLVSRIKMLGKMDLADRSGRISEGRFHIRLDLTKPAIDVRISAVASLHGENVVLRLTRYSDVIRPMESLGLEPDQAEVMERILSRKRGLILISGPADGGKTTLKYSLMAHIASPEINIVTMESPIAYPVASFNQILLPRGEPGIDWDDTIRAVIAQEPHLIGASEVFSGEGASSIVRISSTGRMVLMTIYADNAVTAHWSLFQKGVDPYLVASSIEGSIAVRLARRICPSCSEEVPPDGAAAAALGLTRSAMDGMVFMRGKGCPECAGTGYRGRIGVFEVMPAIDHLKEMIASKTPSQVMLPAAREAGMMTLSEAAIEKAGRGETTLEEAARII